MRYELKKLLSSRALCLVLILALAGNGWLFYRQCTLDAQGYTLTELKATMEQGEALELRQQQIQAQLNQQPDWETFDKLVAESEQLQPALVRLREGWNYHQIRQDLVDEANIKLRLGFFTDPFSRRSLELGAGVYEALAGVEVKPGFYGQAELLTAWQGTDLFALVLALVAGLQLFTLERGNGAIWQSRPTRHGRSRHYFRKLAAAVTFTALGAAALYGTNFLIAGSLLGMEGMGAAAQSVYGYARCQYPLSVAGLLMAVGAIKLIWLMSCLMVILAVCAWAKTAVGAMLVLALYLLGSAYLGESSSLWLRSLSLWDLARGERLLQGQVYLNLFSDPLPRQVVSLGFGLAQSLAGAALALGLYIRVPGGTQLPRLDRKRRCWAGCSLAGHQWHQALISQRGVWILLGFLLLQIFTYAEQTVYFSEQEAYRQSYARTLQGPPSQEKEAFLQREAQRFAQLEYEYQTATSEAAREEIRSALRAKPVFTQVKEQYEQLKPGQSYVYDTLYIALFGREGQMEDKASLAKLLFALLLLLFGLFSVEKETGVQSLIGAAGKEKVVLRQKAIIAAVYVLVCTAMAALPYFLVVTRGYGSPLWQAQANSARVLSWLSDGWSMAQVVAFRGAVFLAFGAGAALVVAVMAEKLGKRIPALLSSACILLIPLLIF